MRAIERQMLSAIYQRRDWCKDNTEVQVIDCGHTLPEIERINIKLHGNHIATIEKETIIINDTGWQTTTTKSRLNALLREFCKAGIYQSKYQWYIETDDGTQEMNKNVEYQIKRI